MIDTESVICISVDSHRELKYENILEKDVVAWNVSTALRCRKTLITVCTYFDTKHINSCELMFHCSSAWNCKEGSGLSGQVSPIFPHIQERISRFQWSYKMISRGHILIYTPFSRILPNSVLLPVAPAASQKLIKLITSTAKYLILSAQYGENYW